MGGLDISFTSMRGSDITVRAVCLQQQTVLWYLCHDCKVFLSLQGATIYSCSSREQILVGQITPFEVASWVLAIGGESWASALLYAHEYVYKCV